MNVAELIAILGNCNPEASVDIQSGRGILKLEGVSFLPVRLPAGECLAVLLIQDGAWDLVVERAKEGMGRHREPKELKRVASQTITHLGGGSGGDAGASGREGV